jgi:tRNA threonylcarbamoyl adenosine modification protein YeaZ
VILAIEAGGDFASVSLGDLNFSSTVKVSTPRNSESLLKVVDHLRSLRGGKVTSIAVAIGPGSYTGLRVGLACAQGLAFGFNVPLVGISAFLGGLFSTRNEDGEHSVSCLLREGEAATCQFLVAKNRTIVTQLGPVTFGQTGGISSMQSNAEGILRAASSMVQFVPYPDCQPHFVTVAPGEPTPLMYLKPVQAKTLIERGIV